MAWPAGRGNEAPWDWLEGWRRVYHPGVGAVEPSVEYRVQFETLAARVEKERGAQPDLSAPPN